MIRLGEKYDDRQKIQCADVGTQDDFIEFSSIAHAADTGGSDHFELTVVKNSKLGAEIADLKIKNISGKTGTNVTFEADLPTIFHDKDLKKSRLTWAR